MRTLLLLLQGREARESLALVSADRENEFVIRVNTGLSPGDFMGKLEGLIEGVKSGGELLDPSVIPASKIPLTEKFDYILPPPLLLKQFAANMLDMGELKALKKI
jgi:hypothetical protein